MVAPLHCRRRKLSLVCMHSCTLTFTSRHSARPPISCTGPGHNFLQPVPKEAAVGGCGTLSGTSDINPAILRVVKWTTVNNNPCRTCCVKIASEMLGHSKQEANKQKKTQQTKEKTQQTRQIRHNKQKEKTQQTKQIRHNKKQTANMFTQIYMIMPYCAVVDS